MPQQLLSSFGKKGVDLDLATMMVDIDDTNFLSKYFSIAEFNPVLTAGRNPIAFNGSNLLKEGSEIQVQCIDSNGNSLYIEPPQSSTQFSDVAKFVLSIHVYNETYNGTGKIILVGTTVKDEVVRWVGDITIDKTIQNASKVRFYNKPSLEVRSLLYPVIDSNIGSSLTFQFVFTGSFSSFAAIPRRDTNKRTINPKKTDVDYRVVLNASVFDTSPQLFPTRSFNTQMEGQPIVITAKNIQSPFSYIDRSTDVTASLKVKKVIDSKTLSLNDAFFFPHGSSQIVTNINNGIFTASYKWVAYNTSSDSYQKFVPITGSTIFIKQSYAEIVYRNIRPFSGFIARHKLYRKSLVYPGDFQLIIDEPLGALEMMIDPITSNKSYTQIGSFYNQSHINKYWFVASGSVNMALSHSVSPLIDSVKIASPRGTWADGSTYIIAKNSSEGTVNDAVYHPYQSSSFDNLTGSSYNSNFINLKAGALYVLSMNIIMEKPKSATDSKVSFYFTSSIDSITKERDYISPFGLRLGEIFTKEEVSVKTFRDKQMLFFTPSNDYYGTLVIVPNNCNITLSELSLKVYGDYGFSPDILFSKIPFGINIPNEGFLIKAELFDIDSTLVYSDLQTIQSFDPAGESLFVFIPNSNIDPTKVQFISGSLTISQSLLLPNLSQCPSVNTRLLAWRVPVNTPPLNNEGLVCRTNVSQLQIGTNGAGTSIVGDYITLGTVAFSGSGLVESIATSLSIKYDGATDKGRKIIINSAGSKSMFP
jgi:hypothetical protein